MKRPSQLLAPMVRAFWLEVMSDGRRKGENLGKENERPRIKLLGVPNVCSQDGEEQLANKTGLGTRVERSHGR